MVFFRMFYCCVRFVGVCRGWLEDFRSGVKDFLVEIRMKIIIFVLFFRVYGRDVCVCRDGFA